MDVVDLRFGGRPCRFHGGVVEARAAPGVRRVDAPAGEAGGELEGRILRAPVGVMDQFVVVGWRRLSAITRALRTRSVVWRIPIDQPTID